MNIQVPFIIKTEQNDGYNYGEMYQPQMLFPYNRPLHLPSSETPHAVQPPDGLGVENYYYQGYNMPIIVQNTPQTYSTTPVADENNQQNDQPTSAEVSQFEQMSMDIKRKLIDAGYQYHDDKDKALKPFSCDVCHKSFGRLSHVRRHQLLHTGEVYCFIYNHFCFENALNFVTHLLSRTLCRSEFCCLNYYLKNRCYIYPPLHTDKIDHNVCLLSKWCYCYNVVMP